jgi:CRISP-associated protein Cas1
MIKRTLYFGNPAYLKTRNEQLLVSYKGIAGMEDAEDKTVPIEDIGVVILDHQQLTVTQTLLHKLLENNVAVITCNATHHPVGMLLNLDGHSIQSERFKAQIEASEPLRKQLWAQTIVCKIQNQAAVLESFGVDSGPLPTLAADIRSGDKGNAEATAAAYYWRNLFPPYLNFYRKRDGAPPNHLLNYGYAIVRAITARNLVGSGLLPTLGIFHRNRYNAYCLADDIMEPYRPYVDYIVRSIVEENKDYHQMSTENKNRLLNVASMDITLNGEKSPLFVGMQRTTATLAKCFEGETKKILYPKFEIVKPTKRYR